MIGKPRVVKLMINIPRETYEKLLYSASLRGQGVMELVQQYLKDKALDLQEENKKIPKEGKTLSRKHQAEANHERIQEELRRMREKAQARRRNHASTI